MTPRDYYNLLEISDDADADTLKMAHRKLAMKYHPDRYHNDPKTSSDKFMQIQEAYAVLSDPAKRAVYDRQRKFGHTIKDASFSGTSGGGRIDGDGLIQQASQLTQTAKSWLHKIVKNNRHSPPSATSSPKSSPSSRTSS